ncbi:antibiotic biosynthesis monooxygenase [Novosphingobium sp. ZN18A2]|uniref:antibiotic biosynthesis monooxygenase family protein n=1 Tax=Novosphingobium sp. ZN18A2 TaxID=3079861 RepID=UPI0030D310B2
MYVNVFRSHKHEGHDAARYAADAEAMRALAETQPGFISFKSFAAPDGETLSMSEWESEEHARAWQRHAAHIAVQGRGRADYYESYTVYSCAEPEVRRFKRNEP